MAKLCPKGKAAAKRKFKVYPSAYANMYASKVCKGKVRSSAKDGGFMSRPSRAKGRIPEALEKAKSRSNRYKNEPSKSKRTKMREGGMVIEDMTKMIEV